MATANPTCRQTGFRGISLILHIRTPARKHMAVLQLDDVAGLHTAATLEHHEVGFRSGKVQGCALLDLAFAGQQHAIGHDLLFEKGVQVGDVRNQGRDHRLEFRTRRDHGGLNLAVVLADAGYCNEPDLLELEDRGIDAHVALGREGKSQVAVDPARLPATHRMGEKLASPAGKARYAQRKWLSEAPNGWIKEVLGFRRFSLRGLAKVRGEWDLVCLALNIKRMGTVATC